MGNLRATASVVGFVLAALVSVAAPGEAQGCFMAYHARRIVLGGSNGGVVILELDWERVDGGDEKPLRWRGPVRVGLLAAPGGTLRDVRQLGAVNIRYRRHTELEDAVKRQMRAGLAAARSYPGFQPAGMPRHQACDFESSCGRVSLGFDPAKVATLSITGEGAPLKVPLTVPRKLFDDVDAVSTQENVAAGLGLVSLLSYDVAGREVLVVDLGNGDRSHSEGEQALWPPCGCEEVSRCPPLATTMHHGAHFEVVVPLATPRPPLVVAGASDPKVAPLDARALSQAEGDPKATLRSDGIYAAEPSCRAGRGWSRRFLRFFPDGTVRQVDGNETPEQAYRDSAKDSHWMVPGGTVVTVGRRVSAVILEDKHIEPRRKWTLDGILAGDALRAMSGSATAGTVPALFHFTQVK